MKNFIFRNIIESIRFSIRDDYFNLISMVIFLTHSVYLKKWLKRPLDFVHSDDQLKHSYFLGYKKTDRRLEKHNGIRRIKLNFPALYKMS